MTPSESASSQNIDKRDYFDPEVVKKFEAAVTVHRSGDLDQAETEYREILRLTVDHPGALNLLGTLQHQKGDHAAAVDFLAKAIEIAPNNPDFYSNQGAAYSSLEDYEKAEACFRKALSFQPDSASWNANLTSVLMKQDRLESAYPFACKAVSVAPDNFKYAKRLGDICRQIDRFDEAAKAFEAAISIDPEHAETVNNLGYCYERLEELELAEKSYRRALEIRPDSPEVSNNLAGILRRLGRREEADEYYQRALDAPPEHWSDGVRRAITYLNSGDMDRALAIFEKIKDSETDNGEMWSGYAAALSMAGQLDAADTAFEKASKLIPDSAQNWNSYGSNTARRHDLAGAVEQYKKAIECAPTYHDPYINLCLTLMFLNRLDEAYMYAHMTLNMPIMREGSFANPVKIFRGLCDFDALAEVGDPFELVEDFRNTDIVSSFLAMLPETSTPDRIQRLADLHFYWAEKLALPPGTDRTLSPAPVRQSNGKLRIGFVSSDLKSHSVANFVLPILRHYDRDRFEVHCFSPVEAVGDKRQELVKSLVDDFLVFENPGYRDAAQEIHNKNIDVLFELNGFTKDTMINALSFKPAPLQVYWLGYPFTTGMPEMDHILVDQYFAPENTDWLAETPLYMPEAWVCYDSLPDVPITDALPVETNGRLTFGTLNAPYKFTPEAVAVWATIMKEFEDSQFLLVRPEADSLILQNNLREHFARCGVAPERVQFINNSHFDQTHFSFYNLIDISLDSFPQTGGTTTCDAIWMGVPVISLVGPSMHQRVSYSLLENAGCGELACFSLEEYMGKAVMLGNDLTSLREYRHNMRPALLNSPLCQGERFTENFQNVVVDAYEKSGV